MAKKSTNQTTKLRTPIVAVMGHVDHGKTSLLDKIRETDVQAGEVGGITQNTRAHKVSVPEKITKDHKLENITFIDTPGHEAFSNMRSRGARVADIVMLVVAADDGVQPQTKESIEFIKKNNIPVVVAANKTDLPGANLDKIKQELSQFEILVEEYGGDTLFVPVSAETGEGIHDLLENIALLTEINELYPFEPTQGKAEAFVLESHLDSDLGSVALTILKAGEISKADYVVESGRVHKIRATLDEQQQQTEFTNQGDPVWLIGLDSVLDTGKNLLFYEDKDKAEEVAEKYEQEQKKREEEEREEVSDKAMFANLLQAKADRKTSETNLNVIVNADTKGTLEAVKAKIETLSYEDAKITVFSANTGNITRRDVETAGDINGIVLGFQVEVGPQAEKLAREERILVRTYSIIYDLIDEVDAVIESMLSPEEEIEEIAVAKVKQVFTLSDGKQVAGCVVESGDVIKGYTAYVDRKGEEIADGKIVSLKQGKEDVKKVKKGMECGIMLSENVELNTGDKIVCYKTVTT